MKRAFLALLTAAALALSLTACSGNSGKDAAREPLPVTGELTATVLRVGKADAIVITTATKTMVIDTGETDDGGKVLNYLNEQGRTRIDYLVITHYDRDHVGGADRVLNFAEVLQVYRPDYVGEREEYDTFVADLQELAVPDTAMKAASPDVVFMMDDAEITIDPPQKDAYLNDSGVQLDNNFSLVVTVRHGSKTLLFTGDCEDARLAELITGDKNWSADFLKVPYHGNFTKLTSSFLSKVKPAYAVACDSAKNPLADETRAVLTGMNAQVFETKDGSVVCHSDGTTLTVTQLNDDEG